MELEEYNDEVGKFELVTETESQFSKLTALQSLLIGKEIDKQELPFLKEYKCIKQFFESKINSPEDTSLKKLFATGVIIAINKGILPFVIDKTAGAIASTVDEGLTRAKLAYKTSIGDIDSFDAIDVLIDKTAARTITVLDKVIDKCLPIAATKIANVIGKVCPPAKYIAPFIPQIINRATPKIKEYAHKGVKSLANFAKDTVRTAAKAAVRVGRRVSNWIKSKL